MIVHITEITSLTLHTYTVEPDLEMRTLSAFLFFPSNATEFFLVSTHIIQKSFITVKYKTQRVKTQTVKLINDSDSSIQLETGTKLNSSVNSHSYYFFVLKMGETEI